MGRMDECFCGSGKKYRYCHNGINIDSIFARLYRFYLTFGIEIENGKREQQPGCKCDRGCSGCCANCFSISESEFVSIIDYIKRNWDTSKANGIIRGCKEQAETIREKYPQLYQSLEEYLDVKSIECLFYNYFHSPFKFPFPCIFLDNESKSCMIYEVRPLMCRLQEVSNADKDLQQYKDEIFSFILLRSKNKVIIRKPFPIFYFFNRIFEEISDMDIFTKTFMYNRITLFTEKKLIEDLLDDKLML